MFLLVFLLGSVTLSAGTGNGTSNPGILISPSKMLMMVTSPSIDLDLSRLDLRSLNSLAFENCASVRTLDLSNNWINELSPGVFSSMTNLEHLSLAYNDLISKTMKGAFRGLANLKSLDITHNPLSRTLGNEIFVGLSNFSEIYIGGSKNFRTITPLVFGKTKKREARNDTSARESKNCTVRLSYLKEIIHRDQKYSFKWDNESYSDNAVKMCTHGTTLTFIDFSNVTDTLSPNCRRILINDEGTILRIAYENIAYFDKGWFRVRNTSVNEIRIIYDDDHSTFKNLTNGLLNDLPENIKIFSLEGGDIERLNKGVMVNKHLRGLYFQGNFIKFIEAGAFAGMNLTYLNLGYNLLSTLDYVPTLPETLLWLVLKANDISEIPGNSFSRQTNLLGLDLNSNTLMELQPPALDGLTSLQWLDLGAGEIKNLRPGVFRDLSQLHRLNLPSKGIKHLDKGTFNGLGCLAELDLSWNRLTRIDGGMFYGLTDSLEKLELQNNRLEILEADTFAGMPKYNLSLKQNTIRKIEKDTFDLPYLRYLDLRENGLTTIEKGASKRLGSLADKTEVRLGFNPIERLDNGVLAGLRGNARVSLAFTPIKVIEAGVFDDL